MEELSFVIGVDFGTDSVRAVVVNAYTGEIKAVASAAYPRWKEQLYCDPVKKQFRQHPLDYVECLQISVKDCLQQIDQTTIDSITAISIDTTGSTPVAVDKSGTPLSMYPEFATEPDAMFVLWKDHTGIEEASIINKAVSSHKTDYLKYSGGIYSSEWFWSKLLHVLRTNKSLSKACYGWVEHCDWMPFLLTGGTNYNQIKRSVCAAGHKGLWSEDWGGYPAADFMAAIHPQLGTIAANLPARAYSANEAAGNLCKEWADRLGLSTNVRVGVGALDAHVAAVGGQIKPYYLSKVMGTSTCDMLIAPKDEMQNKFVRGISGSVPDSIIPGMIGMEAGQSAFGDIYAWYKNLLLWPLNQFNGVSESLKQTIADGILSELNHQAAVLEVTYETEISLDWFNGRRSPMADPHVTGAITGLTLGSDAVSIYRSLAEASCFGAKAIVECFKEQSIPIHGVIGVGGVAKKAPFIMQLLADVLGIPIVINKSDQTGALGAAMFAATVAGIYKKVEDAIQAMSQGFDAEYRPDFAKTEIYDRRYLMYKQLGAFNLKK